jgi:hypothetical protein
MPAPSDDPQPGADDDETLQRHKRALAGCRMLRVLEAPCAREYGIARCIVVHADAAPGEAPS